MFYRCVDWGNSRALTSFKFECGIGTVFSKNKGDICVHPNESEREECGDFQNEIDSDWENSQNSQHSSNSVSMISSTSSYPAGNGNDVTQNNQCSHEGFMEDPSDCTKFYRCVKEGSDKNVKYVFTCGSGTVWDQDIEGCNHPWAVSRKECRNSLPGIGVSNTEEQWNGDSSTKQPGDSSGTPGYPSSSAYPSQPNGSEQPGTPSYPGEIESPSYPIQAGQPSYPGQMNKPTTGFTDIPVEPGTSNFPSNLGTPGAPPIPATSILPPRPVTPNSETPKPSVPQSITTTTTTTRGTSKTPGFSEAPGSGLPHQESTNLPESGENQVSNFPGICSAEGFFPNPENCRKFYRCVDDGSSFTKYEFECGEGTGWDSNLETCNHLYLLPNCDSGIHTNGNNSQLGPSISDGNLTTKNPNEQSPSTIPVNSMISTMSSDSSSTSLDSNNIMSTSSTGISSSTATEISSLSSSTSLDIGNIMSTSSMGTSATTASETSSVYPTISSTYLPSNTVGPSTPSYGISSTTASSGSSPLTPPQSPSQIPTDGIPAETSTGSGQISSTTVSPTSSASAAESTKPGSTSCQEDGFFPNVNDCRKFYRCVKDPSGYRRFDFDCGPGTAWDQGLQTCNYISQVSSCQSSSSNENVDKPSNPVQHTEMSTSSSTSNIRPTSDKQQGTTSSSSETSSPTATSESPTSSSTLNSNEVTEINASSDNNSKPSSETPNCSPSKQNNTIVCNNAGFYPHPTRCDKFYRCVDNGNGFNVFHFDCPPGTIFDPSISVCNYPESVYPARDCSLGQGSSTESGVSDSSTTLTSEKPLTSTEENQVTTTAVNPAESTTSKEESGTEESTTISETTGPSSETTSSEMATTDENLEPTTSGPGNESTEMSTESSSEASSLTTESSTTTQSTEAGSTETSSGVTTEMSSTTQSNDADSTETSSGVTEQSSMTTESTTEISSSQESPTTTEATQETTDNLTDSTEQSGPTPSTESGFANCPIAANLTDEQVLLVCPSGFRRHPKFCNLLYQCTSEGNMEIKILTLSCPENTIFDEMKVQCLPEAESSQPCMGSKANARFYRRLEENSISPVSILKSSSMI